MDQESTKRAQCQAFFDSLTPSERARLALYFHWILYTPRDHTDQFVSLLARTAAAKSAASEKS